MVWSDRHGMLGTNLASRRIIGWITQCNVIQQTSHNTPTYVARRKWWAWIHFIHAEHMGREVSYSGLRASSGPFYTFPHCENWPQLEFIDINSSWPQPPCSMKDETTNFLQPPFKLKGVTFQYTKDHLNKNKRHHVNNRLSEVVFTLVWLVWHNFLFKDTFTSSSFLFQSLPLCPSCGNECQESNVSYLEARTCQALN